MKSLLKYNYDRHFETPYNFTYNEILIFLVGAMTIVEIIDHFNGFATIKGFIKTNKRAIANPKITMPTLLQTILLILFFRCLLTL